MWSFLALSHVLQIADYWQHHLWVANELKELDDIINHYLLHFPELQKWLENHCVTLNLKSLRRIIVEMEEYDQFWVRYHMARLQRMTVLLMNDRQVMQAMIQEYQLYAHHHPGHRPPEIAAVFIDRLFHRIRHYFKEEIDRHGAPHFSNLTLHTWLRL